MNTLKEHATLTRFHGMHYVEAVIRYYLARYTGWGKTRKH